MSCAEAFASRPSASSALRSGYSQTGLCARSLRSVSGLTRILSNRGESFFMTDQYARTANSAARLDKRDYSPPVLVLTTAILAARRGAMTTRDRIMAKLSQAFVPARLDVIDESVQHSGHAGHRTVGQT